MGLYTTAAAAREAKRSLPLLPSLSLSLSWRESERASDCELSERATTLFSSVRRNAQARRVSRVHILTPTYTRVTVRARRARIYIYLSRVSSTRRYKQRACVLYRYRAVRKYIHLLVRRITPPLVSFFFLALRCLIQYYTALVTSFL